MDDKTLDTKFSKEKFCKEDIGKTLEIIINLNKIEESTFDEGKIPYTAIKDYRFIQFIKLKSTSNKRITDIGSSAPTVNPISIGKGLGASTVMITAEITGIYEDYLEIKRVRSRKRGMYMSPL